MLNERTELQMVERLLKICLGGTYGGPSLSWDSQACHFVIYRWTDAPVSMDELAVGRTLEEVADNFFKRGDK